MSKMALLVSAKRHPENDLIVTGLDSIAMDIAAVIGKDQASVKTLIETLNSDAGRDDKRSALIDATRQPLAACHLLVEAMEVLERACGEIDQSVTSDCFGGVEVISASFRAVMMAINENLKADLLADMKSRTAVGRAELQARFQRAVVSLGSSSTR
jgi:formiminotetrahydrofolate cyclodeaminase